MPASITGWSMPRTSVSLVFILVSPTAEHGGHRPLPDARDAPYWGLRREGAAAHSR